MEVILLERIHKLGVIGDKVKVKPGYGRNYLIPQGKALPANEENMAEFEKRRAELERVEAEKTAAANARKEKLDGLAVVIEVRASEEGKLFGSVGIPDIMEAVSALNHELGKNEVRMPAGPVRQLGEFDVEVDLGHEVVAVLKLEVKSDRPLEEIQKAKVQETSEGFGEFEDPGE